MTEWRTVPSLPDYEVSEDGRVKRLTPGRGARPGHELKPYIREDGYAMFIVRTRGRSVHRKAHQLVAETFLGGRPAGRIEVRHLDGTRTNNHWRNLAWGSSADNKADMALHGTRRVGERHHNVKLTDEQVQAIRAMCSDGCTQQQTADVFGIRQGHVSRIVNGVQRSSAG